MVLRGLQQVPLIVLIIDFGVIALDAEKRSRLHKSQVTKFSSFYLSILCSA